MTRSAARAGGFSLVELMIALVAGLIVSAAVLAFFFSSMKSNGEYVQSTRLTQELRNSMGLVTQELLRAGYDEDALKYMASGAGSPFLPICVVNTSVSATTCVSTGDCIIYAYDKAGGTIGQVDVSTGEVLALRRVNRTNLDGRSVGVIEFATSFSSTRPTCGGAGPSYSTFPPTCNATTGWCALSDPTVLDITALAFTDIGTTIGTSPNQVRLRDIGVNMTGQIAGTTGYTRNLQSSIRVRSDCYNATIGNCLASP